MPLEKFAFVIPNFLAGSKFPDTSTDPKIFTEIVGELKIKTLISLTETSHSDARKFVQEFGLQKYLHLPISDFSVPSEKQIREFISVVFETAAPTSTTASASKTTTAEETTSKNQEFVFVNAPTLIHCHLGAGRTGLMLSIGIIAYYYFCLATKNEKDPIFQALSQHNVESETKKETSNLLLNLISYHRKVRPQSILTTKQVRFLESLLLTDLTEDQRRDLFTPPCCVASKL